MPAIGITGGISTGKTSFIKCLREIFEGRTPQRGVPPSVKFFDADAAARELTDRDPEVRGLVEREFGAAVYSGSGDLNREKIRTIVFADAEKKRALEQILHPRIRRQWSLEAEGHRNSTELFFADIPLLYETGGETLCDRVVVVACSPGVQLERLMARARFMEGRAPSSPNAPSSPKFETTRKSLELRPPLDAMSAQQMIDAQMPLTEKISRADHVVWNNAGREVLKEQARLLVELWKMREVTN
jgi:dephospho-CoA kinase